MFKEHRQGHVFIPGFILATMLLLVLMVGGFDYLAQRYPGLIDMLPGITVESDPTSGGHIFLESWGRLFYPILVVALLTTIFLKKTGLPEDSFVISSLVIPLVVILTALAVVAVFGGNCEYEFGFFAIYLLFVLPYLLGALGHYLLSRLVW
ncbi:hypothetical protein [Thermococcus camini]|uniref:Uncharacterized protein n=1 Tax=Thermococcus camini TaxID=2016373 RepID=A0A7G2D8S6_9EURY|nr:hypothetical protein [Thermococcus camini]CAD5243575.1 conserved membrane protein of unknown function [Thermococcus camini]